MSYKVETSMKTGEYAGQYGQMIKYAVKFEDQNEAVELSQKPETPAPKTGDVLEGEIEDTKWGKRFKKARVGGYGSKSDPEVQKAIIRQNSLTNAVNYCIAKSQTNKKYELSGKHIIQVATFFSKYSLGQVSVVMSPEEIASEFGYTKELTEEPKQTAVTGDSNDDLNPEGEEMDLDKSWDSEEK